MAKPRAKRRPLVRPHLDVMYPNGYDVKLDRQIRTICGAHNGIELGSGCQMIEPYTRDMTFRFRLRSDRELAAKEVLKLNTVSVKRSTI